jgi:hypothetical protein
MQDQDALVLDGGGIRETGQTDDQREKASDGKIHEHQTVDLAPRSALRATPPGRALSDTDLAGDFTFIFSVRR